MRVKLRNVLVYGLLLVHLHVMIAGCDKVVVDTKHIGDRIQTEKLPEPETDSQVENPGPIPDPTYGSGNGAPGNPKGGSGACGCAPGSASFGPGGYDPSQANGVPPYSQQANGAPPYSLQGGGSSAPPNGALGYQSSQDGTPPSDPYGPGSSLSMSSALTLSGPPGSEGSELSPNTYQMVGSGDMVKLIAEANMIQRRRQIALQKLDAALEHEDRASENDREDEARLLATINKTDTTTKDTHKKMAESHAQMKSLRANIRKLSADIQAIKKQLAPFVRLQMALAKLARMRQDQIIQLKNLDASMKRDQVLSTQLKTQKMKATIKLKRKRRSIVTHRINERAHKNMAKKIQEIAMKRLNKIKQQEMELINSIGICNQSPTRIPTYDIKPPNPPEPRPETPPPTRPTREKLPECGIVTPPPPPSGCPCTCAEAA